MVAEMGQEDFQQIQMIDLRNFWASCLGRIASITDKRPALGRDHPDLHYVSEVNDDKSVTYYVCINLFTPWWILVQTSLSLYLFLP